jgi:hypothetical protein
MAEKKANTDPTNVVPLPTRKGRKRRPRGTARLLSFVPRHKGPVVDHETVRHCEWLLKHALSGRITGVAWIAYAPQSPTDTALTRRVMPPLTSSGRRSASFSVR